MTIRVAINGYGRIGRCILRSIFEYNRQDQFEVVAINDLSGIESTAYLTRYDSTHGRFGYPVTIDGDKLIVNGHPDFNHRPARSKNATLERIKR